MTDPLAEKIGINVLGGTVNVQHLNIGIAERMEKSGDHVRILVVAANPLGSSPLKLDHEVKTIKEALKRSRKSGNFVVEYCLAATPSELRRALLDLEPHVLHFSGHGAGEKGLLFVSDESVGAIYRSDSGELRSRSTNTNEIKFVPAQPLANLLQLCEDHLECVVLNACYSDVQGDVISANIPFTIGMRDVVQDNVAIKFSQGFYDAIGSGKSYEKAFEWGKVAIEFDLVDEESAKILVLRKKGEPTISPPETQDKPSFIKQTALENVIKSGDIEDVNTTIQQSITPPLSQPSPSNLPTDVNSSGSVDTSKNDLTHSEPEKSSRSALGDFLSEVKKKILPPLTAKTHFERALEKQKRGDNQGAISSYTEVIRLNPDYASAYYNRGLAKRTLEDYKGAIADYNKVIHLKPNYAEAYMGRGLSKYELSDKQESISDYNEAIRLKPDNDWAYMSRGIAKFALGDKQEAIADYDKAISLRPDYAYYYFNRGIAKRALEDYKGAIIDYNEAISLNSSYAEAYNNRGLVNYELGSKQAAFSDYDKAISINSNFAEAYNNRGLVNYELRTTAFFAIVDYDKAISINPNYAEAYKNRGDANFSYAETSKREGDNIEALYKQKAINDYNSAISLNPKYAEAYKKRGDVKSALGIDQGAIADYDKAINLNPEYAEAYVSRGNVKSKLRDKQGAIAEYDKAISINPEYAGAYICRGIERYEVGDKEGAIADYDKAISINPNYAEAYVCRGLYYQEFDDHTKAAIDFRNASKLYWATGNFVDSLEASYLHHKEQGNVLGTLFYSLLKVASLNIGVTIVTCIVITIFLASIPSMKQANDFERAKSLLNNGLAYYSQKDTKGKEAIKEAIDYYNEGIKIKPDYAEIYNNRGNAKRSLGDIQGAINDYDKAISLKSDYETYYFYYNRGLAKSDLNDWQGAISDYNEAILLNPNLSLAYNNRGNAKSKSGDKKRSITDYNEAIRLNPDYAEPYYSRGNVKKDLGDKQGALADFRKASELYHKQGNTEWYNKSRDRIKELGG